MIYISRLVTSEAEKNEGRSVLQEASQDYLNVMFILTPVFMLFTIWFLVGNLFTVTDSRLVKNVLNIPLVKQLEEDIDDSEKQQRRINGVADFQKYLIDYKKENALLYQGLLPVIYDAENRRMRFIFTKPVIDSIRQFLESV